MREAYDSRPYHISKTSMLNFNFNAERRIWVTAVFRLAPVGCKIFYPPLLFLWLCQVRLQNSASLVFGTAATSHNNHKQTHETRKTVYAY